MKRIYWIVFRELNEDYLSKYDQDFHSYEYSKNQNIHESKYFSKIRIQTSWVLYKVIARLTSNFTGIKNFIAIFHLTRASSLVEFTGHPIRLRKPWICYKKNDVIDIKIQIPDNFVYGFNNFNRIVFDNCN